MYDLLLHLFKINNTLTKKRFYKNKFEQICSGFIPFFFKQINEFKYYLY